MCDSKVKTIGAISGKRRISERPIRPGRPHFDIFMRHSAILFFRDRGHLCIVNELNGHTGGKNTNERISEYKLGLEYSSTANGCIPVDAF